jgi:hypothetical protein
MFFLYGYEVGQTSLSLERVKEGAHKLKIGDLEKEIYVKEGKTLKVGLFKGRKEPTSAAGRNSLTEASSTSRGSAPRAARTSYGRTVNPSLVAACLKFSSRHTISEPTGDSSAHISADAS